MRWRSDSLNSSVGSVRYVSREKAAGGTERAVRVAREVVSMVRREVGGSRSSWVAERMVCD